MKRKSDVRGKERRPYLGVGLERRGGGENRGRKGQGSPSRLKRGKGVNRVAGAPSSQQRVRGGAGRNQKSVLL